MSTRSVLSPVSDFFGTTYGSIRTNLQREELVRLALERGPGRALRARTAGCRIRRCRRARAAASRCPARSSAWSGGAPTNSPGRTFTCSTSPSTSARIDEPIEVGLRLLALAPWRDRRPIGRPRLSGSHAAGLQQIVIGHGAVVALAGLNCRLLALDRILPRDIACLRDAAFRRGPTAAPSSPSRLSPRAPRLRPPAVLPGAASLRAARAAACASASIAWRTASSAFSSPIVEPKQRIARLHFLADLAPSLRRRRPAPASRPRCSRSPARPCRRRRRCCGNGFSAG